jgi:hypothetical protein
MSGRAGVEYADATAHGQAIQHDSGAVVAEAAAADPATAAETYAPRPPAQRRSRRSERDHLSPADGLPVARDPARVRLGADLPSPLSRMGAPGGVSETLHLHAPLL